MRGHWFAEDKGEGVWCAQASRGSSRRWDGIAFSPTPVVRFAAAVALRWMARVVYWLMQPRDGDGGRIWCPLQLDADELSAVWLNVGEKAKNGHSVPINVASVVRQGPNPGPGTAAAAAAAVGIDPAGAVD